MTLKFSRPDWEEWALGVASAIAARGDCRRSKVGAVILDTNHRIIGAGYNGSPPGAPGCLAGHCPRAFSSVPPGSPYTGGPGSCIALHAEVNAIMDAGRKNLGPGCTLYCTRAPCAECEKLVRGFGVDIVWARDGGVAQGNRAAVS